MTDPLARFAPATREWFRAALGEPTPVQAASWSADDTIARHRLVVAPTGSGKTLAAFLESLDELLHGEPEAPDPDGPPAGTTVLYISPLKALGVDVERNLRSPLVGITATAARRGESFRDVTVGVRSGDTSAAERRRLRSHPPDILITTPESLFLLLTSAARETLRHVRTVIVDEVHAVAGTKRGAHLALTLERLDALQADPDRPPRRIGLSATVRPHDEVARFLGGQSPVHVVAPASPSRLDLRVVVPVDDLTRIPALDDGRGADEGSGARSVDEPAGSIWPHIEAEVLDRIGEHRSTLVFVNSRGQAERLTSRLNDAWAARHGAPEDSTDETVPVARAHHGSVSKEQRDLIEDALKAGTLPCVVATSSLELGIDMGAIDLVVQVAAPPSVANGLQRVGRAGHQVGEVSRGIVHPVSRSDLLSAAVTAERMRDGLIEAISVPANPLDVLAQQTVAACALEPLEIEVWFDTVRRSAPFAALPRRAFEATLDLLAGRYPSESFAELRPRVVWDREAGTITGRPGAQRLAVTSGGTIPDRGMFTVVLPEDPDSRGGRRVGELDEEMVYESRVGDVVALGATSWRINDITHDRVVVTPAPGEPARLPFWRGDAVGRSAELGEAIGAFCRTHAADGTAHQGDELPGLDARARTNLAAYLADQRAATGVVPTDRTLVVERFRDELGDWRVVLLSPYGRRVHAPWALAVGARITERYGVDGAVVASDDGIVARVPDVTGGFDDGAVVTSDGPPGAELFVFEPDELERLVTEQVSTSALFASRFRECAARSLLLPRRSPGSRSPLWQQRQRAAQLLDVARDFEQFPVILETVRECLQDVYDLPALDRLVRRIASREVALAEVVTEQASPFARTLVFGYVAAFLYEGDTPLAERRAAALALDAGLLAELLGRAELRELLDPEVLARTEAELQRLAPDRQARGLEGIADLVRTVGPLTADEVRARCTEPEQVDDWLATLRSDRRVVEILIAGEPRWAAVEDAGRLRDALGSIVPLGIAEVHLQSVPDPLGDLAQRWARTHGPFTADDLAGRLGLGTAVIRDVLRRLARDGRLTEGEFRPQATGTEWVDPAVLRRLRSRSLAAARSQVEPVDPRALARFLPAWHEIGRRHRGPDAVLAAVEQLAGVPLPASAWESVVLPARVADYSPAMLDELLAAGEVIWSGAGTLAGRDGWLQLHPGDLVLPTDVPAGEHGERHTAVLDHLADGGAYLFARLRDAIGDPEGDLLDVLWQLVWEGRVSNDTLAPIRTLIGARGTHRSAARPPRARVARGPRASMAARPPRPGGPPGAGGRWFAVTPTVTDPTALALARTETLLARHGVVTRGAVQAEGTPGGFAAAYRVLRELESTGACLRGYFVDTLGAAQFASAATVDRLRSFGTDEDSADASPAVVLAAIDPAQPFGAALPWPARGDDAGSHRPARRSGALVVLHDGRPILFIERGGRTVLAFTDDSGALTAAAEALVGLVRTGRVGRLTIETVDDLPVGSSPVGAALREAGFERHPRGLRLG